MLSTLCCGLRNLLGLIGGEQPNNETEPFQYANANAELEGHERLRVDEALTEAVQCTEDQEGPDCVEQAGHSYGTRKFLSGMSGSTKNPYKPLMVICEEKCHNGAIKEKEKNNQCRRGVKLAVKLDVEARLFSDTEEE